jgi:DNA-binding transcriptional LysR family regulator
MKRTPGPENLEFLLVFDAVLQHKTITRAAEHLGISQPALSHALERLRQRFGDPLFVRSGGLMQPTPFVTRLADPLQRALGIVRSEILGSAGFQPETTERVFKVAVTEIGAFVLVPRILQVLRARAPRASLAPLDVARTALAAGLESGAVDIAVGHFPELKAGIYQQQLATRSYAAIVSTAHPTVKARMTARQFQQLPIVRCSAAGVINEIVERHFADQGLEQQVALETQHIMAVASIVGSTDWMAFVPDELVAPMGRIAPVRKVEVPMPTPQLALRQHWHRRFHADAANQFLRSVIHAAVHE